MRLNTIFLLNKICLISKKMDKLFIIDPLCDSMRSIANQIGDTLGQMVTAAQWLESSRTELVQVTNWVLA